MRQSLGETGSSIGERHALICPDSHERTTLPGWLGSSFRQQRACRFIGTGRQAIRHRAQLCAARWNAGAASRHQTCTQTARNAPEGR